MLAFDPEHEVLIQAALDHKLNDSWSVRLASHYKQGSLWGDASENRALNADGHTLNRRYRERFGFPFIAALRLHDSVASVLQAGEVRLANDARTERRNALQQVCEVMRGRLALAVSPDSLSPSTVTALAGSPS